MESVFGGREVINKEEFRVTRMALTVEHGHEHLEGFHFNNIE
jgi:hypothetical protein